MANTDPAIPPDREPDLAIGPQWPDGHVLEGALVLEYIQDRVADVPHDLVAVYDARDACVILQGTVRDQPMRDHIVDVARGVPGVAKVDDRMTTER
ncbi:MAG TPA: BON domain-containing protein [Usitatibacter sp.]|nr:BON domain-containing protein [Usitatibacter sp.]